MKILCKFIKCKWEFNETRTRRRCSRCDKLQVEMVDSIATHRRSWEDIK